MGMPSFSALTRSKEIKVGTYIGEFVTPGIGRILASAGCDFALVDMEHSGFTFETVKAALRALHDAGVASLVRPVSKSGDLISRACDVGAQGIMPPKLSTVDEARAVLKSMKYTPLGERGVAFSIAHDDYAFGPFAQKLEEGNQRTSFIAMIETVEGVDNAEAIAALDGVEALWIGQFDLSCSLGAPGAFDGPLFKSASERVVAAAKRHDKALGRSALSVEEGAALLEQGFDFIMYSGDIWLLQQALASGVDALRAHAIGH
jgi:2-dehydro-3-deoxyglucarate aldolase/4-hydroxy-2-oxoheptanedioate aldolase